MSTYSIGSMAVSFEGDDSTLVNHAKAVHQGWEWDGAPQVQVRLCRDPSVERGPRHPTASRAGAIHHMAYWGWRASFDPLRGVCEGRFGDTEVTELERNRVQTLTRMLLGQFVLNKGGLTFHASSMTRNGQGFLFAGGRGAGKTTSVRRWPGDQVLGDEHAVVVPERDGYTLYSTPYSGREGTPSDGGYAPLNAVFLLAKDSKTWTEPLKPAQAFRELVPHLIHISGDQKDNQALYDGLMTLVTNIPTFRLHVSLTEPFWPTIEDRCYD